LVALLMLSRLSQAASMAACSLLLSMDFRYPRPPQNRLKKRPNMGGRAAAVNAPGNRLAWGV
jgi:hypothetical protein